MMGDIPPPPSIRETLPSLSGLYDVLLKLGAGGMGTVYLARMAGIGGFERQVVVKRMNPELLTRGDLVRRFLNEAKIASFVHHANVVGVQLIGEDQDGYFLVLDYVEGDSLDGLLNAAEARNERLPLPVLLRIFLDGLAGLHAIHEARDTHGAPLGILHRDVSTCNFLVGVDGVTRVTDFGVAKSVRDTSQTGGLLVGKALYMAPEYLLQKEVDRRMDVYAMGVALWISLMRRDPWPDLIPSMLMVRAVSDGVPPITDPAIPKEIAAIVAKACDRDPDARFPSAHAFASALASAARRTVQLAEPLDVAATVSHLAGEELHQRRMIAGDVGDRMSLSSRHQLHNSQTEMEIVPPIVKASAPKLAAITQVEQPTPERTTPQPESPPLSTAGTTAPARTESVDPRPPRKFPIAAVGMAVAGALVAVVITTLVLRPGAAPEQSARAASVPQSDPAPVASASAVAPPAASAVAAAVAPSAKATSRGDTGSRTRPAAPRSLGPAGLGVDNVMPVTPAAPAPIVTGNPYR